MTMRRTWIVAAIALALATAWGCGGGAKAPEGSPGQASGERAGVVPGSYEDWCDEHGVPETACTRCDATLIPAFKAVGDWCDEHGLPKSQCLKCDPTLKIGRPPKPQGS
jgi:hypothetical protein